jgi:carbonic anhydrase
MDQNRLNLHGWVYDIGTGSMDTLDDVTGHFVPLAGNSQHHATPAISGLAA